jgi:hypothetical protein
MDPVPTPVTVPLPGTPAAAPPLFSAATYNVLAALIVPLLLTTVVLGYVGRSMCRDYAIQKGSLSVTGAFLGQVCGAPSGGDLVPGIHAASLTVVPQATAELHHASKLNTSLASELSDQMQDARKMFNQTRNVFTSTIDDVYAVMMNIVVQLVRMGLKTRDIAGKMGGATAAIASATQGAQMAGESILNGPIMAVMKTLANA